MSMAGWTPLIEPSSDLGARAIGMLDALTSQAMAADARLDLPLLLTYRALADGNPRWMKLAAEHLNTAIAGADALYSTRHFELFGGLSGLGWVTEHVIRQLARFQGRPERDGSRINEDTDQALLLELQRGRWQSTYDLTTGLTGIGLYFLQRLPGDPAKLGLELVIGRLEAGTQREAGVARGLAGMLYLLGQAAAAGVDAPRANRLLRRIFEALLEHQVESPNSCSWSEGELGIAAVCLQLGPRADHSLLDRCLEGTVAERDLSLLNGAAGAAHMWTRISRITGDARDRQASLSWWKRAIELHEKTNPTTDTVGVGFLGGAAGTGLALLAALTPVEPAWDGLLCLSPQPYVVAWWL
jgi:lantibiotic biosynthesis protein